ncbi:L-rhamnose mutarotase [Rubellicoccus peritrichatus]|uniref:L-rhamnose mutarotase n=1 Tax=Rubellicoccus peritrichatus TaxID=3080537 RepID=A0AAQ3QUS3_9BACT|nr:L-rhamnose mutarotase [Puniceicoccus sp. CR14]WOO42706.1 L-rhamnose mutarotase [Puniceicoccus sp. CR14]
MKRYGCVIGVKEEKLEEYLELHRNVWPAVEDKMHECNIRNFTIFLRRLPDGKPYLFCYFEYVGENYEADMAKNAADETTQKWWSICKPCQEPLADREEGEWWANMEEIVHHC